MPVRRIHGQKVNAPQLAGPLPPGPQTTGVNFFDSHFLIADATRPDQLAHGLQLGKACCNLKLSRDCVPQLLFHFRRVAVGSDIAKMNASGGSPSETTRLLEREAAAADPILALGRYLAP